MMPTSFNIHSKTHTSDWRDDWYDNLTTVSSATALAGTSLKDIASTMTNASDSWKVLYRTAIQNYNWGKHYYSNITIDDTCDWDATPVTTPRPVGKPISKPYPQNMGYISNQRPSKVYDVVITDEAHKIRRRAAPREFNKYINASDLLEEFIHYCGEQGVRQSEMLELPVDLFIKWLIIRACEEDKEEPNVTLELPAPKRQCRCLGCGKFMRRGPALPMHDPRCYNFYFVRSQNAVARVR